MKHNGQQVKSREVREVVIPRTDASNAAANCSLRIKVRGFPIGFNKLYEAVYPKPSPPFKLIMKKGEGEVKQYNYEDEAYVKQFQDWLFNKNMYMVWMCTKVDGGLEFDTKADNPEAIKKIQFELDEAGFSEGDVGLLLDGIRAASNITNEAVKEAAAGF